MEALSVDTEESAEYTSGPLKSRIKSLRTRLFVRSKRAGEDFSTKFSQSASDILAGKTLGSDEDLAYPQGIMGSRALSHDSIFWADQVQTDDDDSDPVRVLSQENVHSKIKALQMKLQQQKMHLGPPPLVLTIRRQEDEGGRSEERLPPHKSPEFSTVDVPTHGALRKCVQFAIRSDTARATMATDMIENITKVLVQSAKLVEDQVDAELTQLNEMDEDDLEKMRERRLEALKKAQKQKQEWLSKGHGEYREIPSEKEFFGEVKESKKVVCHFYRNSTFRCKIVDKHLAILAKKHVETKFIKLNVEKAPFLAERLRIKVIPTLVLLIDGKSKDYVVGFGDLGNTDEFSTEMLEWRLGCADVITYSGNLMEPPTSTQKPHSRFTKVEKKTIRGRGYDTDSDDDDDN